LLIHPKNCLEEEKNMEPRIENRDAFIVMGVSARGNPSAMNYGEIWNQFSRYHEQVEKLVVDKVYYNVYFGTQEEDVVDLIAGVAIKDISNIPKGLVTREVSAMRCALFKCEMKDIGKTYDYIYREWLPKSQYEHDEKPDFECFPSDGGTSDSPVLIHIPIKEKM
jgi:AraC family transcriptional regulator